MSGATYESVYVYEVSLCIIVSVQRCVRSHRFSDTRAGEIARTVLTIYCYWIFTVCCRMLHSLYMYCLFYLGWQDETDISNCEIHHTSVFGHDYGYGLFSHLSDKEELFQNVLTQVAEQFSRYFHHLCFCILCSISQLIHNDLPLIEFWIVLVFQGWMIFVCFSPSAPVCLAALPKGI